MRGWFSVYRSQNVCQTFLTLHHSLGELHQPHSIFRLWENPMTHAPLMTSPSVSLTAPLPNQAFPWPGWPHHLVVTGCLCHKGSGHSSQTKKCHMCKTPHNWKENVTFKFLYLTLEIRNEMKFQMTKLKLNVHCEINEIIKFEMTFKIKTKLDTSKWTHQLKKKKKILKKKNFQ